MKILIHVAAVEHAAGTDFHTGATEAEMEAKVAAHCRRYWETCGYGHTDAPPEDAKCIEIYFDDHDSESLAVSCESVEIGLHAVVEVICQKPCVAVFQTEDAAMGNAVQCAVENLADPDGDKAEAAESFRGTLDEHGHVSEGDYEVHLLTPGTP